MSIWRVLIMNALLLAGCALSRWPPSLRRRRGPAEDGQIGSSARSAASRRHGNDMRNSFELALDHLGRKIGGLPVEVIYEDDQIKPEVGVQRPRN